MEFVRVFIMKKLAFIIAFTFSALPVFPQQEKEVQTFLENIYGKVADMGNTANGDYELLVEKLCSRKFREFYNEIRRWENRTNECLLHFGSGGYDLFLGCQDYFDSIRFSIGNVHKIADDKRYSATVTASFFCREYEEKEWETVRTVFVAEENGEWRIYDFQSPGEDSDLEFMKKALPDIVEAGTRADTAMIADRIEKIYREVAEIAADDSPNTGALDRYLSRQYLKLYNEIGYWEEKLGEMIIGKDCWIRLQDWNKLEYKIDCIKVTSPSKAVADVISTDTWQTPEGEKRYTSKIRLDLVFENDNWMIDDFADYNGIGGLYESDSKLYAEGIKEALELFEGTIDYMTENEQ